jgi:L-ribulose-5-phosphate 4-epimerase
MSKQLILPKLRELTYRINKELSNKRLVAMTSGNASARDPKTGYVVVKPSGVSFEDLAPDRMVVLDTEANIVQGNLKPSVDALTHVYIYRHMENVNGIVHTHSNYATSFAALGQPIPPVLTAMADEFGGPIPCAPYCQIGEEEIGDAVVKYIGNSPSILMQNHGVFAVGPTLFKAFKAAVMTEDVAKTVHLAMLRGTPIPIPEEEVRRGYIRYQEKYGQ